METKQIVLLAAFGTALIVLMILFFTSGGDQPPDLDPVSVLEKSGDEPEEIRPIKTIVLFFLSDGDRMLHREEREIYAKEQVIFEAKQSIEELIKGSLDEALPSIPAGTRLRELYITQEGVAYVDFSREICDNHLSGSSAEIATVFAIVNTLTQNFKSIRRVSILIEGDERETLNGHIDLTRPLLPRLDLISNR